MFESGNIATAQTTETVSTSDDSGAVEVYRENVNEPWKLSAEDRKNWREIHARSKKGKPHGARKYENNYIDLSEEDAKKHVKSYGIYRGLKTLDQIWRHYNAHPDKYILENMLIKLCILPEAQVRVKDIISAAYPQAEKMCGDNLLSSDLFHKIFGVGITTCLAHAGYVRNGESPEEDPDFDVKRRTEAANIKDWVRECFLGREIDCYNRIVVNGQKLCFVLADVSKTRMPPHSRKNSDAHSEFYKLMGQWLGLEKPASAGSLRSANAGRNEESFKEIYPHCKVSASIRFVDGSNMKYSRVEMILDSNQADSVQTVSVTERSQAGEIVAQQGDGPGTNVPVVVEQEKSASVIKGDGEIVYDWVEHVLTHKPENFVVFYNLVIVDGRYCAETLESMADIPYPVAKKSGCIQQCYKYLRYFLGLSRPRTFQELQEDNKRRGQRSFREVYPNCQVNIGFVEEDNELSRLYLEGVAVKEQAEDTSVVDTASGKIEKIKNADAPNLDNSMLQYAEQRNAIKEPMERMAFEERYAYTMIKERLDGIRERQSRGRSLKDVWENGKQQLWPDISLRTFEVLFANAVEEERGEQERKVLEQQAVREQSLKMIDARREPILERIRIGRTLEEVWQNMHEEWPGVTYEDFECRVRGWETSAVADVKAESASAVENETANAASVLSTEHEMTDVVRSAEENAPDAETADATNATAVDAMKNDAVTATKGDENMAAATGKDAETMEETASSEETSEGMSETSSDENSTSSVSAKESRGSFWNWLSWKSSM